MKREATNDLILAGGVLRQGYSYLIANVGKAIATISALIAVMITFTEIGFEGISTVEVATEAIVITICSYVIYFSMQDAGMKIGEEEEGYKRAMEKFKMAKDQLTPTMIAPLRSFLTEYKIKELEYRRDEMLIAYGISKELYEKDRPAGLSKREKRAIRRVKRIKPIRLDHVGLMGGASGIKGSKAVLSNKGAGLRSLFHLLPSTLATVFTVSLVLKIKPDMTPSDVIQGLIRLSALPVAALKGYLGGFRTKSEDWVLTLEVKTQIIEEFLQSTIIPAAQTGV